MGVMPRNTMLTCTEKGSLGDMEVNIWNILKRKITKSTKNVSQLTLLKISNLIPWKNFMRKSMKKSVKTQVLLKRRPSHLTRALRGRLSFLWKKERPESKLRKTPKLLNLRKKSKEKKNKCI